MVAQTEATIRGSSNAWSIVEMGDLEGSLCRVALEIESDGLSGFHLVMSPDGFFTADTWHPTIEEALEEALELFGVATDAWTSEQV